MIIQTTVGQLKSVLKHLEIIDDKMMITFNKDCVETKAVDPTHTIMLSMNLSYKFFNRYENDTVFEKEIPVQNLLNVLKGNKNDIVYLKIFDNTIGLNLNETEYNFELKNIDDDYKPKIPILNLTNSFEIETNLFLNALENCGFLVLLYSCPQGFSLVSKNMDNIVQWKMDARNLSQFKCFEKCESSFAIDSLKKIVNTFRGEKIKIEIGTDYPIIISDKNFKYILAPCIENEETKTQPFIPWTEKYVEKNASNIW